MDSKVRILSQLNYYKQNLINLSKQKILFDLDPLKSKSFVPVSF